MNTSGAAETVRSLDVDRFEQLVAVLALDDFDQILTRALQVVMDEFHAQAGSLFFFPLPATTIRLEGLPAVVNTYIESRRTSVQKRLRSGSWRVIDQQKPPVSVEKFENVGLSVVNAPLLNQTRVIGAVTLVLGHQTTVNLAYRDVLTQMIKSMGQIISVAADLFRSRKRYQELDLLYQVSQTLTTTLEINTLLEMVMTMTADMLDAAAASVILIREDGQNMVFSATSHTSHRSALLAQTIDINEGIAGWVVKNGRPTLANDVTVDPRFCRKVDTQTGFLTLSIAAAPLQIKGQVVGVIEALNKNTADGFTNEDLRLLTAIAAQTVIALENARLYQDVRQERDKIIQAQEEIRRSLASTLHDGAIQQMSAISMNVEYVQRLMDFDIEAAREELENIKTLALNATKEARTLLFELRPVILETEGLIAALQRYVDQLREQVDFEIQADFEGFDDSLDPRSAGTIFSIIREAMNNIRRHAQATLVKVLVTANRPWMVIVIEDNGLGFDVDQVLSSYAERNSLGLLNMRERAQLISGNLKILSQVGQGTHLELTVPIKRETGLINRSLVLGDDNE